MIPQTKDAIRARLTYNNTATNARNPATMTDVSLLMEEIGEFPVKTAGGAVWFACCRSVVVFVEVTWENDAWVNEVVIDVAVVSASADSVAAVRTEIVLGMENEFSALKVPVLRTMEIMIV